MEDGLGPSLAIWPGNVRHLGDKKSTSETSERPLPTSQPNKLAILETIDQRRLAGIPIPAIVRHLGNATKQARNTQARTYGVTYVTMSHGLHTFAANQCGTPWAQMAHPRLDALTHLVERLLVQRSA